MTAHDQIQVQRRAAFHEADADVAIAQARHARLELYCEQMIVQSANAIQALRDRRDAAASALEACLASLED